MPYFGLVALRPKDRNERKNIKNILETKYQCKVTPVPRGLRKEAARECLIDINYKSNELLWLVEFPSRDEYNNFAFGSDESQINSINPVDETPSLLSKMNSR